MMSPQTRRILIRSAGAGGVALLALLAVILTIRPISKKEPRPDTMAEGGGTGNRPADASAVEHSPDAALGDDDITGADPPGDAWPSPRPFGRWLDNRTYVNDFLTPLRIVLPPSWLRANPPGGNRLVVERTDGMGATDPSVEARPAEISAAFVFWAD